MIDCLSKLDASDDYVNIENFVNAQDLMLHQLNGLEGEFKDWRQTNCENDDTFRFWDHFIHQDCMYYIGLWIALRTRNWNLRLSCVKDMIPLFNVTDHYHYAKILPQHLADIDMMYQSYWNR